MAVMANVVWLLLLPVFWEELLGVVLKVFKLFFGQLSVNVSDESSDKSH